MSSPIRWKKTTFFQIHQNRKVINVKLNVEKKIKKTKRRVKTKTRHHFSRHRKTIQSRKNKCKTCPTRKETNKIVFFGKRRKQRKKAKETIQDQEKKKNRNSEKSERNENTRRDKRENKWIEDEQKEGIKRQSRLSKRENVELVEVNVKSSKSEVSK